MSTHFMDPGAFVESGNGICFIAGVVNGGLLEWIWLMGLCKRQRGGILVWSENMKMHHSHTQDTKRCELKRSIETFIKSSMAAVAQDSLSFLFSDFSTGSKDGKHQSSNLSSETSGRIFKRNFSTNLGLSLWTVVIDLFICKEHESSSQDGLKQLRVNPPEKTSHPTFPEKQR